MTFLPILRSSEWYPQPWQQKYRRFGWLLFLPERWIVMGQSNLNRVDILPRN